MGLRGEDKEGTVDRKKQRTIEQAMSSKIFSRGMTYMSQLPRPSVSYLDEFDKFIFCYNTQLYDNAVCSMTTEDAPPSYVAPTKVLILPKKLHFVSPTDYF